MERVLYGRSFLGLLGWLGVTLSAAALGAVASIGAADFYARLERPDWAPPAAAFGPVWTLLYLMMAVAAWNLWRRRGWREGGTALGLFLVQLLLNALWSWLFFVWQLGAVAFLEVSLLWLLILATLARFWVLDRVGALLLLPYLVWVGFAAVLNFVVWQANPALLG